MGTEKKEDKKWEEKRWELEENGKRTAGKMFVKMGWGKWELEEKGVKNWELKGLEQERILFGDGGLHDTFFKIKLLKPKYIFLIIDVKITLLNTQNSP